MTDKPGDEPADAPVTADPPHAPEAKVHHEPASAHTDAPADHRTHDMEGVGGHGADHAADEHGHGDVRLGPVDWGAWGYAIVGVIAGIVVVAAFWFALA